MRWLISKQPRKTFMKLGWSLLQVNIWNTIQNCQDLTEKTGWEKNE